MRRRGSRNAWRFREIVWVLIWSWLSNLLLLSVFMWYTGFKFQPDIGPGAKPQEFAASLGNDHTLAVARLMRSDYGLGLYPSLETEGRKQSLPLSVVPPTIAEGSSSAMSMGEPQVQDTVDSTEPNLQTGEEMTSATPITAEEVRGLHVTPILRKSQSTGKLEIGSFKPVTFAGGADECLNFGHSMLDDSKFPTNLLTVLAQSDQITITRICASNGSVIMTCRGDQITISPRRSRPDDNCLAQG